MWVYPHRYFHLSQTNLGQTIKLLPSNEYEPSGVSFSPTIRGCLEGVPYYYTYIPSWERRRDFTREGNLWYVYTPVKTTEAIIPNTIDDFDRTKERRVLRPIKCMLIGTITVSCSQNRWEYKWKITRNCENNRTSEQIRGSNISSNIVSDKRL